MRYLLACLVAGLFVLGISNADAANKIYAGVAGGYAFQAFDQDTLWEGIGADPDEVNGSWAGHVFLGYGVWENLTIEADFGYFMGFEPNEDEVSDLSINLWDITGSAKYGFPMGAFTPYVIGGLGWAKIDTDGGLQIPDSDGVLDSSQSGLLVRIGGGVEYKLNDQFTIIGDVGYNFTFGDIEDWNFIDVRVGIGYTFQ
jgi:opacity protein-like surface antigen